MTESELTIIIHRLLKTIAPDCQPESLQPSDPIQTALGLDSFDFLRFIISLCEETEIGIPEDDYGKIGTLKLLLRYLTEKSAPTGNRIPFP